MKKCSTGKKSTKDLISANMGTQKTKKLLVKLHPGQVIPKGSVVPESLGLPILDLENYSSIESLGV